LRAILQDKVPKEQERVKNFRKAHGATKVGEVNVDMVSKPIQGHTYIPPNLMIAIVRLREEKVHFAVI
jgi:hypothetical protein